MEQKLDKPTCKVGGLILRNAMCGHIIVGGKYCGFTGDCKHKSVAEMVIARYSAAPGEKK